MLQSNVTLWDVLYIIHIGIFLIGMIISYREGQKHPKIDISQTHKPVKRKISHVKNNPSRRKNVALCQVDRRIR